MSALPPGASVMLDLIWIQCFVTLRFAESGWSIGRGLKAIRLRGLLFPQTVGGVLNGQLNHKSSVILAIENMKILHHFKCQVCKHESLFADSAWIGSIDALPIAISGLNIPHNTMRPLHGEHGCNFFVYR